MIKRKLIFGLLFLVLISFCNVGMAQDKTIIDKTKIDVTKKDAPVNDESSHINQKSTMSETETPSSEIGTSDPVPNKSPEISIDPKKTANDEQTNKPELKTPKQSVISGTIQEKGTRKPLERVTFFIKEEKRSLTTDEKGSFSFTLKPGVYTLIVPVVGYDKLETPLEIKENENIELVLRLVPQVVNPYQIVVRSKKNKSEVSAQRITVQEAALTPGGNRDVLNVVTNMPGVSSVSPFGGYGSGLVIRGSAADDSSIYVNDHVIPILYHFGGIDSVIEPELVESIDFDAGGFSAEFGETMGGVVSLKLRDPRTDRFGGYVNLSLLSSSFMLEGPISKNDSYAISMKRGFIDTYAQIATDVNEDLKDRVSFERYPNYYDGSFIYKHSFSKRNTFKLVGIGASEGTELLLAEEQVSSRISNTISDDLSFANLFAEWHYKKGKLKSVLSPMIGVTELSVNAGSRAFFKITYHQCRISEKLEYKINKNHLLKTGARLTMDMFEMDSSLWSQRKEGEAFFVPFENEIDAQIDETITIPSVYLMDQITYGNVLITPGFNALYDTHNQHGYIDPRILAKYKLSKTSTVKVATGIYSKTPPFDESYPPWGTEGLKPERSFHFVTGFEHQFTDALSLDVQGYYKKFYDMIVRIDENDPTKYDNDGEGESQGAEIFLRHDLTDNFFGWLSYSYSVSKRKDGKDKEERYFDWDIPHNLRAVLSYKPNRYWVLGVRYRYASGTPYTDLLSVQTLYDVDNDNYIPLYNGPINNKRLDSYHLVDFRVDKLWLFDNWVLSTYLDIRNIFRGNQVISQTYNEDYTEVDDQESLDSIIPFIFLGIKMDF